MEFHSSFHSALARRARRFAPGRRLRIELLEGRTVPSTVVEVEPNNTFGTAQAVPVPVGDVTATAAADWLTVQGSVGAGSDADYYTFTVGAAAGVFFDLDARDVGLSATLDAALTVYDAAGAAVPGGANDDGYDFEGFAVPVASSGSATSKDPSLYLDLAAGTYAVRVTSAGGTTGSYNLRLLADPTYSAAPPVFHSNPGAADALYLDFDGYSSNDEAWGNFTADPYDFDGVPTRFSPAERLAIQNEWRMVSEDYGPFAIDITTAPTVIVNGSSQRMVITNSSASIVGQSASTLGISYVGVYAGGYPPAYNVSFTFASNFPTYSGGISGQIMAKPVEMGNTSAHEFGHALGLDHYPSQSGGTGTVLPTAIMGTPDLGLNRETWAVGTTTSNNAQDDMAVIGSLANTFGYRADDHQATAAAATVLTPTGNTYAATGRIEQVTDADWFRFVGSGATTVAVDVDDYVTDLDTVLRLRDASGTVIATSNPGGSFDASLTQTLPGGTYYADVEGTGAAGQAGAYRLTVTTVVHSPPVLSGIESAALAYTENQTLPVTAALAVADPDSSTLTGATVTISAGYVAGQDVLEFTDQNGITGSVAGATLTLTGTASLTDYQTALRSVRYRNSSENPATANRTISFQVTDPDGGISNVAIRAVTVTAVNDPPVADDDAYPAVEDTPLTVAAGLGVLNGDTDPDSPTLTAVLVTNVQHGTLSLSPDGSFTYTPAPNYNGPDAFTYRASDGALASNLATVGIAVAAVNDPPAADDDAYPVDEDGSLSVPAADGVLAGDADVEGDPLTAVLVGGVQHGTLALSPDGSFAYTPAPNYNGPDAFTYRASDGQAASDPATVRITVRPVNDPPVADDDAYPAVEDTPLTVAAGLGVLNGDTDPDSPTLTAVLVTNVQHGTLSLSPDGSFTYTPAPNYNGPDAFTYRASDGALASNLATVGIAVAAVNDPPAADDDAYPVDEDGSLSVPAADGVLAGDADVEGDPLTAVLVGGVQHGTLALSPDGSFAYTPAPNYNGPDAFTYRASDGQAASDPATVRITVRPVNDPPVAQGDSYSVTEDGSLDVAAPGVRGNDTDIDGDPLTAILVAGPTHGTFNFRPDGSFTYSPVPDYNGPDAFTYKLNDGTVDSTVVTVGLTVLSVNDPPVAAGENFTLDEDTPLEVGTPGLLGNDADVDGDPLSVVPGTGPAHGTLGIAADGSFNYTPAQNYNGPDAFTYTVTDGQAPSTPVTVSLSITAVNDPPIPGDDSTALLLKKSVTIHVLANDADPEGGALTILSFTRPTKGTLRRVGNDFVYAATGPLAGADSFTYTISDPQGATATGTVRLSLTDPVVPRLGSVRAQYGSAGRSAVDLRGITRTVLPWAGLNEIDIGFSEDVLPSDGALTLNGPGGPVALSLAPVPAGGTRTAVWNFPALPAGTYTLRLSGTAVHDINGNAVPGDYVRSFGILPGDLDGNGLVDDRDLKGIKKKYQSKPAKADRFADVNGDGIVNVLDYNLAKAALGSRLG